MTTMENCSAEKLAIDGGTKAFTGRTGKAVSKIGVLEFFSIAERFGFTDAALARLRATVTDDDLKDGGWAHLARFWGPANPSMGDRFEALAREQFKVKYAFAVTNGTCALQAALVAVGAGRLGRKPGDTEVKEVICPGTGFLATSMAAAVVGARPVFCDVDDSLQIDPKKIEALITPKTVAIMPTHHWGVVADMDPIMAIAKKHGLKVIEDCAQSPGATYKGKPVGSIGDVGCFSISAYKIIGGGEGGMVTTNDERLFDRLRQMSEGGGLWRQDRFAAERYPGELFPGSNFRISEMESAINVIQMQKLPEVVARYRHVRQRIESQLIQHPGIKRQKHNDPAGEIGYKMRWFVRDDALGVKLDKALAAEGVYGCFYRGTTAGPDWHVSRDYYPLYGYDGQEHIRETCPVAADLYDRTLTFDIDQWFNDADCDAYAKAVNKVLASVK